MKLIIVESPTKANTFNKFLKKGEYHVEATLGHVRDLPEEKMSLDLAKDFAPSYEIVKKRLDVINRIKYYAKKAENIILAIFWDTLRRNGQKAPLKKRISFSE